MLENRRNLILTILGVTALVTVFLFYLWRDYSRALAPNPPEIVKNGLSSPQLAVSPGVFQQESGGGFSAPLENPSFLPLAPSSEKTFYASLVPKEVPSAIEAAPDFLGIFFETIRNTFISPPPLSSPQPASPATSRITITPKELFEFAYPPHYRLVLSDLNQAMIQEGFLSSGQIYPLTSMAEAVVFQDKVADYLSYLSSVSDNGGFTGEQIARYQRAYREILPKRWEEELRAKKAKEQSSFLPYKFWYGLAENLARKKIESITANFGDKLASFMIASARAQITTSPECYREGEPNLIMGSEDPAICCNCGFNYVSCGRRRICRVFVEDCGEEGCDEDIGCLNDVCADLPAIWDPDSDICGCHI